jgi:homoserine kinase
VNRIPTARGLGSSAAAWVGGLVAGNVLLGSPLSRETLLGLAARAEGHPDNVAAAILGGLTVSCETPAGVTAVSLPVTKSLAWVVLVPEVTSATAEARALLPRSVPREDAIFNVQRVALLLAGLQAVLPAALSVALEDRLHQPYRLKLFPWMPEVAAAARAAGALGCVLSGAGPSLLAVVAGDGSAVGRAMEEAMGRAGVRGNARTLDVDAAGATSRVS